MLEVFCNYSFKPSGNGWQQHISPQEKAVFQKAEEKNNIVADDGQHYR
jgi:hypothetical protein